MKARLVIIGAGIVGSAAAYHLARLGWSDIVLLDKGDPVENDGSTSHAPGGVVALSHNKLLTEMAVYSSRLYRTLAPYDEKRKMVNPVGTLEVAISPQRMADLVRLQGESIAFGTESILLSPEQACQRLPYLDPRAFVGALFVEEGLIVAGAHVSGAFQRDAGGAVTVIGHTEVERLEIEGGRLRGVVTANPDLPRIECDEVLIATNIWAPLWGEQIDTPIPLLGYEHQYLVSPPLSDLSQFDPKRPEDEIVYPSVRELDTYIYFRQHWNSYGVGSYRHRPRPVWPTHLGPTAINEFTPSDFAGEAWEKAQALFPIFRGLDFRSFPRRINGIFAFPVDGMPIMGPVNVPGVWVAAGSWLTHAGGVGKAVAEWMTTGETEWDMRQVDVHRFHDFQSTPRFIEQVCNKNYAEIYDIIHPREPITEPRNVRLTPFHIRHLENEAVFTTFAGLELPNWFEANAALIDRYPDQIPSRESWASVHWSPIQGAEHLATRQTAGLFDLSGLSIIEVSGPQSLPVVDFLCSNRVDVSPGRVIYTTWLTDGGGVRRDLTVARLAPDRFWLFVGEGTRPRDLHWVRQAASRFERVAVTDLSDAFTAVGLWGPKARSILSEVTRADLANGAFPYFTSRYIDVGFTRALAVRISYAGELGWELHFPPEFGIEVWDLLAEAGREHGLVPAGMGAFDSLRLEKGYRGWGTDVYTEHDPYQAGLGWTVKLDKGGFSGAEAARRLASSPPARKLSCLTFDDRAGVAFGYEPIMSGEKCVGHVTSANFGYSVGKSIAYGYLPAELAVEGTEVDIIYFGERFRARVAPDPLFDPKMERMKA
ncbi:MAG TPA: FAD-dependent oxidoreductase [Acidimicrobiia bacterium]|nr:FAD-dependent oxidoreductase [Acidimicrobiia bacterium]